MISWRLCLAFTVFFYSNSEATSCQRDDDCPGSKECCDNVCGWKCSEKSDETLIIILVVFGLCVVFVKIVVFVWCCCGRKRRRIVSGQGSPAIQAVTIRTTIMTPIGSQGYTTLTEDNNTVQHGFINLSHDSPPETTLNQGDVIANPTNDPPPSYSKEIQS